MPSCKIEFPVSIGDIVSIKITSLPMTMLDLDRYQETEYLPARVVSLRKNSNICYIKLAVKAYWLEQWFFPDTGDEEGFFERGKLFTFPVSAIGKIVFVNDTYYKKRYAEYMMNKGKKE